MHLDGVHLDAGRELGEDLDVEVPPRLGQKST
jgi:hypothetical protein